MVVWTGLGWIGFVYMVGCLVGGSLLFDHVYGDGYFEAYLWPKMAALLVCFVLCWITGRRLNRNLPTRIFDPPRRVTDPVTGATQTVGADGHTLAFVRLEFAGLVALPLYLFIALEEAGIV